METEGRYRSIRGANRVWQFHLDWPDALQYEGAADMQHLRALCESRPLRDRIPDQSLLVAGQGSVSKGPSHGAATRAADGSYAMVYSTMGNPFTVDLSVLSAARLHAWWYSPRDGRCYNAQRKPTDTPLEIPNTKSSCEFTPPTSGINQDWVLVLDNPRQNSPAPGTIR